MSPHRMLVTLGFLLHATLALASPPRPEAWWAAQQRLFWGEADTGAVHVVGLRAGVSEYGVLRAAQRHRVRALALENDNGTLLVQGDDAQYRYDTRTLRLLARIENQGTRKSR